MGLPVHRMEEPITSSGAMPSESTTDASKNARMALNELIDKKQQLEEELSALGNVLESV